jgi:hypothetical protein
MALCLPAAGRIPQERLAPAISKVMENPIRTQRTAATVMVF